MNENSLFRDQCLVGTLPINDPVKQLFGCALTCIKIFSKRENNKSIWVHFRVEKKRNLMHVSLCLRQHFCWLINYRWWWFKKKKKSISSFLQTAALLAKSALKIHCFSFVAAATRLCTFCTAQVSIPTQSPSAKVKSDPLSLDYSHCCSRMSGGSQRDNEVMGWVRGQPVGPRKVVCLWC